MARAPTTVQRELSISEEERRQTLIDVLTVLLDFCQFDKNVPNDRYYINPLVDLLRRHKKKRFIVNALQDEHNTFKKLFPPLPKKTGAFLVCKQLLLDSEKRQLLRRLLTRCIELEDRQWTLLSTYRQSISSIPPA